MGVAKRMAMRLFPEYYEAKRFIDKNIRTAAEPNLRMYEIQNKTQFDTVVKYESRAGPRINIPSFEKVNVAGRFEGASWYAVFNDDWYLGWGCVMPRKRILTASRLVEMKSEDIRKYLTDDARDVD